MISGRTDAWKYVLSQYGGAYNNLLIQMTMTEPQESAENKYLGHCVLFTVENQRNNTGKTWITKIIWKNNYEMNALGHKIYVWLHSWQTEKCKIPHISKYPTY